MKNIGASATVHFTQESDCCSDQDEQILSVTFKDGGGGSYIIFETTEWAIDSPKQFIAELTKAHEQFKQLANEEDGEK